MNGRPSASKRAEIPQPLQRAFRHRFDALTGAEDVGASAGPIRVSTETGASMSTLARRAHGPSIEAPISAGHLGSRHEVIAGSGQRHPSRLPSIERGDRRGPVGHRSSKRDAPSEAVQRSRRTAALDRSPSFLTEAASGPRKTLLEHFRPSSRPKCLRYRQMNGRTAQRLGSKVSQDLTIFSQTAVWFLKP